MDGAQLGTDDARWSAFASTSLTALVDAASVDDVARTIVEGAVDAFGRVCAIDIAHPILGLRRAAVAPSASLLREGRWAPVNGFDPPTDDATVLGATAGEAVFGDARIRTVLALRLREGEVAFGHLWIAGSHEMPIEEADVALGREIARVASTALSRARSLEVMGRTVRQRDELASLADHELRSPLATMLGWAHLLRSDPHGDRARRGVDAIERGGVAMTRVIEDWREASQLLLGAVTLERQEVALDSLVRAVVEARRLVTARTPVELELEIEGDARAWVDPVRVRELFERMLDRIERTTTDGAPIVVRLAARGDAILLSVEGAGAMDHEPSPTRTTKPERIGDRTLTLAVVRGLAELHGGSAGAERAESHAGARIWALLPRGKGTTSSKPSSSDLEGVNVLLVDDAADSLELAATIVRLRGARAAVASSSSEALALLRELPIDVLVSDIAMPHEDGCSLVRRALELRPGLRAAALSAHVHLEDRERALAAGFETYLTKPIDPETLARTVRSLAHVTPARAP